VYGKCSQNLLLLSLGHLEEVKRSAKFGRDLIELGGRDLQLAMGFFQAERSTAWFRSRILLGSDGSADFAGSVPTRFIHGSFRGRTSALPIYYGEPHRLGFLCAHATSVSQGRSSPTGTGMCLRARTTSNTAIFKF
jgi:hypothetical protein